MGCTKYESIILLHLARPTVPCKHKQAVDLDQHIVIKVVVQ